MPYVHAPHWPAGLDELSSAGYELYALRLAGSVEHTQALRPGPRAERRPTAVIVGDDYGGVGEEVAARADHRVRISISGAIDATLDSLDRNVAAAIVLEHLFEVGGGDGPGPR